MMATKVYKSFSEWWAENGSGEIVDVKGLCLDAFDVGVVGTWHAADEQIITLKQHIEAVEREIERLRAIETNVKGIIPFLNRHLQEIRETASGDPGVKYAIEIGYLDCLGTLKDALFEANLTDDDPRHIQIDGLRLVLPTREQPKKKRTRKEK